jgi:mxaJ protein
MSSAFRSGVLVLMALSTIGCGRTAEPAASAAQAQPARVLRVCADPNNLPFSNQRLEGFENRIASLVADRMGAKLEYVWWAQRRGFIRNTLRAGVCDVVMGLPSRIEQAATTDPYYRSSYMFVTRHGTHQPASFDDPFLTTAKVGVHIIGDDFSNSPPAHALSHRGLIDNVRGYSVYGDYKSPNPPADLIAAVSNGDVDVAIAWGPLAGYFARTSKVPLDLTRVSPEEEPPFPFVFDMSVGVARSNRALRDELNQVIADLKPAIDAILNDYAVPVLEPQKVASR